MTNEGAEETKKIEMKEDVLKDFESKASITVPPVRKVEEEVPMGLNAKITIPENIGQGATAAWQAISKGVTGINTQVKKEEALEDNVVDGNSLPVDVEGRLPFFLLDAHEEAFGANPGTLYLFGKVCTYAVY